MASKAAVVDERLKKLQERLTKSTANNNQGWWKPKTGSNVIRILPEVGEMEIFYQPVGRHWLPDADTTKIYCPKFTSEGQHDCPICDWVDQLYRGGKADKELAKNLRVERSFWMNVIDRNDEDAGPMIYTAPISVLSEVGALVGDPDWGYIMDELAGHDITITRTGEGIDTRYKVNAKPKPSPLHPDDAVIDKWMESARDLSYVMVSDDPLEDEDLAAGHAIYVYPYDRIIDEYDFKSLADMDVPEETPVQATPPRVTGRKVKVEALPLPDAEEDDEPATEATFVNPARQRLATRRTQR